MKRKGMSQCIRENGLLQTGDRDTALARELVGMAEHRTRFWQEAKLEERYPSLYLEGHYEIVKELCTAIVALDGWKALNHECLFAYLKVRRNDIDVEYDYLLELKDLRNAIDYRGVRVSADIWKDNKLRIGILIKALKEYSEGRLER